MLLSLAENGIKKKEDLCISIHLVFQVKGTLKAIRHMYTSTPHTYRNLPWNDLKTKIVEK